MTKKRYTEEEQHIIRNNMVAGTIVEAEKASWEIYQELGEVRKAADILTRWRRISGRYKDAHAALKKRGKKE